MDPERPDATAVGVRTDRIAAVGSIAALRDTGSLDERFAAAVLVPRLIDRHLFPA
jgi:predicted amidohydrolase YtcJ